jgi:Predicted transcriptional regulators
VVSREGLHKRFGETLRESRKGKGLTQEALAHEADITPTYVGQLERGLKSPSLWTLHKLSRALDVPIRDLVISAEDRPRKK